jgi:hypothetical protein
VGRSDPDGVRQLVIETLRAELAGTAAAPTPTALAVSMHNTFTASTAAAPLAPDRRTAISG